MEIQLYVAEWDRFLSLPFQSIVITTMGCQLLSLLYFHFTLRPCLVMRWCFDLVISLCPFGLDFLQPSYAHLHRRNYSTCIVELVSRLW